MTLTLQAIGRKWHERHARVRLAAAAGNWSDIDRLVEELEREASEGAADDAGDGVDPPGTEDGG